MIAPLATSSILAWWNRLQMGWPHAARIPAQMVDVETFGDRAYQQLIGDAVRHDRPLLHVEFAIAPLIAAALPLPAALAFGDLRPETLW
jgi:hypothetical protein